MGLPVVLPSPIGLYRSDRRTLTFRMMTKAAGADNTTAVPVDLTQYGTEWSCQVRPAPNSTAVITTLPVDSTNAATGELTLSLVTSNWADALANYVSAAFDIQVIDSSGEPLTFWAGKFKVLADVTRP